LAWREQAKAAQARILARLEIDQETKHTLCVFRTLSGRNMNMALLKIAVMVQSWKLLCPHDKLQLLNSKVGRAKEVGVYAIQDFWQDKVSRPEDSFMYENTGDWRPPMTWTYYFI